MTETIMFEVTDLHAEMLEEVRTSVNSNTVNESAEDFVHNLYKQVKRAEKQQVQSFKIQEPEERE